MKKTKEIFQNIIGEIDTIYEKLNKDNSSDNFFSMSTKAYYENPFTKILSYILSNNCQSSFRENVLKGLLKDICSPAEINFLEKECNVKLEHRTLKGNRIDLILHNDNIVVAIEVKIHHKLNNPLDDYETEINRYFSNVKNKKFVILSYKSEQEISLWKFVSIKETFDNIFNVINSQVKSISWDYYITDFIKHFKNKDFYTMDEKDIQFIEDNFTTILKAKSILDNFITEFSKELKDDFSLENVSIVDNNKWDNNAIAIRAYPYKDLNNITLVFNNNNSFYISIYYYVEEEKKQGILDNIDTEFFKACEPESKNDKHISYTSKEVKELNTKKEILELFKNEIENMRGYFSNSSN